MGIPKLRLLPLLVPKPSNLYPKLENFTTQNLTENLVSSVSERKKTPLQGTVMNSFLIYIGVKPTVFQLIYGLHPPILLIDSSK